MENIYGEKMPTMVNKEDKTATENYPTELIITFYSEDNPNLGEFIKLTRNYILNCINSQVVPIINLSFCFDMYFEKTDQYAQKFIAIAEYIENIKSQDPGIIVNMSVRGFFPIVLFPLIMVCNIVMASHKCIMFYMEGTEMVVTKRYNITLEEYKQKYQSIKRF